MPDWIAITMAGIALLIAVLVLILLYSHPGPQGPQGVQGPPGIGTTGPFGIMSVALYEVMLVNSPVNLTQTGSALSFTSFSQTIPNGLPWFYSITDAGQIILPQFGLYSVTYDITAVCNQSALVQTWFTQGDVEIVDSQISFSSNSGASGTARIVSGRTFFVNLNPLSNGILTLYAADANFTGTTNAYIPQSDIIDMTLPTSLSNVQVTYLGPSI